MLKVQEYLRSGKTLDDLKKELGISCVPHPKLPIVILNYNQIESPKTNEIVRECRGLTLRSDNFDLVAKAFSRFFNLGEVANEMPLFDFSNFMASSKEDGSLILCYYFDGSWRINTRGGFGERLIDGCGFTWCALFCKALGMSDLNNLDPHLDKARTYIFELASPYNKVVRLYAEPKAYLLSAFNGENEESVAYCDAIASRIGAPRPAVYHFSCVKEITEFLNAVEDPTFEGVVIRDSHGHRWKIKNPRYLALHRMRGEGGNLFRMKHLLPFVLSGEGDELLNYFPEARPHFEKCSNAVELAWKELSKAWHECRGIADQKAFALAVMPRTKFSGLLFSLRKKNNSDQGMDELRKAWSMSADLIVKTLFKNE